MKPLTSVMLALAASMVLAPMGANAALPPYWQSAKEIAAIVNDERVHDALKYEEPILSVSLKKPLAGNRVYEITTERCKLQVTVAYQMAKPGLLGPAQFDIEVGDASCH
jgi:hypothetical protein